MESKRPRINGDCVLLIRIIIPAFASRSSVQSTFGDEYKPGVFERADGAVVVNLDKTNLFLLFSKLDSAAFGELVRILKFVLSCEDFATGPAPQQLSLEHQGDSCVLS